MTTKIWFCKIGEVESVERGADSPMREAVNEAYKLITGKEPAFIFSGWAGELTEPERAVVEMREPRDDARVVGIPVGKTGRGFALADFTDGNGVKCSLQKSSAAERDMIWLGCDEPNPRHCPGNGTGWHPVTLPPDTVCDTRMHLTREHVAKLLPLLQAFVATGELESPSNVGCPQEPKT